MSLLHDKLESLLPVWRTEIQELIAAHGEHVIDCVSAAQVLGGMRGMRGLACDTSSVDPQQGLFLRGIPVLELADRDGDDMFWLLLTGELPGSAEHEWLGQQQAARAAAMPDVSELARRLPSNMPPVAQYGVMLMSLQHQSRVQSGYGRVAKSELWHAALEDALDLRSWARQVFLTILTRWHLAHDAALGGLLSGGSMRMLSRLYDVVHSDHENGNASAFACHTVGSALADPYLALVASVNALAGPIHGKAAQTCLEFIQQLQQELGAGATDSQVADACWARLHAKQIIPGFGHAVLRGEDPRFVALKRFGDEHCADEPLYQLASALYRIAPGVLKHHGAAASPYPNVDAIGGVLLWCCGLRYPEFYTIMFSLAQMNGLLANYVLARGLGLPIMRPRSVTLAGLRQLASAAG